MGSLKKILTIVLCAAMIMAGSVYVNASDSVSDSDSSDNLTDNELQAAKVENEVKDDMGTQILGNDMKEKIGDEVEVLDDLGYTDDSIDDVTVKDGDIVYQQTFETEMKRLPLILPLIVKITEMLYLTSPKATKMIPFCFLMQAMYTLMVKR